MFKFLTDQGHYKFGVSGVLCPATDFEHTIGDERRLIDCRHAKSGGRISLLWLRNACCLSNTQREAVCAQKEAYRHRNNAAQESRYHEHAVPRVSKSIGWRWHPGATFPIRALFALMHLRILSLGVEYHFSQIISRKIGQKSSWTTH